MQRDDPWSVRILPKVHFGVHPVGLDGIEPDAPGISVLHHYLGTWKVRGGWSRKRVDLYRLWRKLKAHMAPEGRYACLILPSAALSCPALPCPGSLPSIELSWLQAKRAEGWHGARYA